MGIFSYISKGLGWLMRFIYYNLAFENYGLAIIIFTLLTKIALLPLAIKSFKSTMKMRELNPEIKAIQRLYKNDPQRMNEELQKLYQKYGVSPFSGCLPLLIQLPILLLLYDVIRKPLTYIMGIGNISNIVDALKLSPQAGLEEIAILTELSKFPEKIAQVSQYIKPDNVINLNFLGIFNLGALPSLNIFRDIKLYLPILLIPILAALTTYLQTKITQKQQMSMDDKEKDESEASMEAMNKSMGIMMSLMILFFSFSVPAGLGIYWITGNVTQIFQQLLLNRLLARKKEGA